MLFIRRKDRGANVFAATQQGGQQLLLLDAGQRLAYARSWNTLCEEHQIVTRSVARESFWQVGPWSLYPESIETACR